MFWMNEKLAMSTHRDFRYSPKLLQIVPISTVQYPTPVKRRLQEARSAHRQPKIITRGLSYKSQLFILLSQLPPIRKRPRELGRSDEKEQKEGSTSVPVPG